MHQPWIIKRLGFTRCTFFGTISEGITVYLTLILSYGPLLLVPYTIHRYILLCVSSKSVAIINTTPMTKYRHLSRDHLHDPHHLLLPTSYLNHIISPTCTRLMPRLTVPLSFFIGQVL